MGLEDLFQSKAEKKRKQEKLRRKAIRDAEKSVGEVKSRVSQLKRERDQAWGEARQYLKDGQKAAAQRGLQTCLSSEMLISKLEMKRWVFEGILSKLKLARIDMDFTDSLRAINEVVEIDVEAVDDVLDAVQDKLGDQDDTDKIWERVYDKEMEGLKTQMTDTIPSIEEMEKLLEDEVAAELGSSGKVIEDGETGASVKDQIREGRSKLKDLLEGDK